MIFKQTHDKKLAETFESINKITDEVVRVTRELKSSNVVNTFVTKPPKGVTVSNELFQTLAIMSKSINQLKEVRTEQNRIRMKCVVIEPSGGNKLENGNKSNEVAP